MFAAGILVAGILVFNYEHNDKGKKVSLNLSSLKIEDAFGEYGGEVVYKPTAVLCDSGLKYKTTCGGSGGGCEATSC